jgi:hypothetical protein
MWLNRAATTHSVLLCCGWQDPVVMCFPGDKEFRGLAGPDFVTPLSEAQNAPFVTPNGVNRITLDAETNVWSMTRSGFDIQLPPTSAAKPVSKL